MYSGEDLYDGDDEDDDRVDSPLTHFFLVAVEAAAWLIGLAVAGALIGADLESSPWFWVILSRCR
jgi:hypothetical protein